MIKKLLILCISTSILAGCKKEVTCSSEETQNLVKNSFLADLHNELNAYKLDNIKTQEIFKWAESNLKITLINIQTTNNNKDTGAQTCHAQISTSIESPVVNSAFAFYSKDNAKLNTLLKDVFETPNIINYHQNNSFTDNIEYITQRTDNGESQTISITKNPPYLTTNGFIIALNSLTKIDVMNRILKKQVENPEKVPRHPECHNNEYCNVAYEWGLLYDDLVAAFDANNVPKILSDVSPKNRECFSLLARGHYLFGSDNTNLEAISEALFDGDSKYNLGVDGDTVTACKSGMVFLYVKNNLLYPENTAQGIY